ncbi:MAG: hypothetical protein M9933_09505 [Chitinophagaceae bacterium]|nr:hypothetical protein [Chitinophagaceae bacterium]
MKRFFRNNGLSIVFLILFIISLTGQILTGFSEYNKERIEDGLTSIPLIHYLSSGHFLEATFENWESEFLQMALFVVLTISLRQKGSSESKSMEGINETDREPNPNYLAYEYYHFPVFSLVLPRRRRSVEPRVGAGAKIGRSWNNAYLAAAGL